MLQLTSNQTGRSMGTTISYGMHTVLRLTRYRKALDLHWCIKYGNATPHLLCASLFTSCEARHLRIPLHLANGSQHNLLVAHRAAAILLNESREGAVSRLKAAARANCRVVPAVVRCSACQRTKKQCIAYLKEQPSRDCWKIRSCGMMGAHLCSRRRRCAYR